MKYTVQLLDEIWDIFRKDETLAMLLKVKDPTSLAEWNTKMRRGLAGAELVDEKQDIYFVMSFIPSVGGTKNWMVNKNMLEFRLIGRSNNRKLMNDLYIHLNKLLKNIMKICLYMPRVHSQQAQQVLLVICLEFDHLLGLNYRRILNGTTNW